ncbi:uncharacterized protein LOC142817769 isoform X1 [Rhipicephalus microplus]|uniref:uncharacterized protein LOC142817769 isoform X1 n=1 Tax=Rhipicephalus microplus TaxID=6941 RepID=UPI003F6D91A6
MALLTRSCCICSLKTGARYVGIFYIAVRAFILLLYITILQDPKGWKDLTNDKYTAFHDLLILLSCECVINIVVSVILFTSTVQPKRYLILPWLMWNTIGVLVVKVICLHLVTEYYHLDHAEALTFGIIFTVATISQIYFVCIVASFYQELESPHNPSLYDDMDNHQDIETTSLFSMRMN